MANCEGVRRYNPEDIRNVKVRQREPVQVFGLDRADARMTAERSSGEVRVQQPAVRMVHNAQRVAVGR